MHRFHHFPALDTRGHIGLVRDDDDQKPGLAQCMDRSLYSRKKLELFQSGWGIRLSVTHYRAIDSAITIEKHSPLHIIRAADSTADSYHFVAICCRSG